MKVDNQTHCTKVFFYKGEKTVMVIHLQEGNVGEKKTGDA